MRQIWRNHILRYSMLCRGDIQRFHHVHLYPQGNKYFHEYAIPEYKILLTKCGKASFIDLTYESLFAMLSKYFRSYKHQEWLKYLQKRYIV